MPDRPRIVVLGGGFGGRRSGQEAEGCRRRRPARRQARLPHVPAAPVPGRDRPPRAAHGRPSAPRPVPRPSERQGEAGDGHRDRPGQAQGVVRRDEARLVRLPRARARGDREFLRGRRRPQARVPDVHAARRRAPEGSRARTLGGGGPRPGPGRRRRAQRRHRRRRPDRGRERRRARRAVPAEPREGLPRHPAGQGSDHRGRGRGRRPVDVQEGPADLREEGAREAHGRDHARRGGREHRADTDRG